MDAFSLARHLERDHRVEATHFDAQRSNAVHYDLHCRLPSDHDHEWVGPLADPQPPLRERR